MHTLYTKMSPAQVLRLLTLLIGPLLWHKRPIDVTIYLYLDFWHLCPSSPDFHHIFFPATSEDKGGSLLFTFPFLKASEEATKSQPKSHSNWWSLLIQQNSAGGNGMTEGKDLEMLCKKCLIWHTSHFLQNKPSNFMKCYLPEML